MKIRPIKTEEAYQQALQEISRLLDAKEGSAQSERLELLSILVEDYEDRELPIPASDPIAAIEFWLDQNGLTRKSLEPFIGDRAKVADVLARRRPLTLAMIRRLSLRLGIPPSLLIVPYPIRKVA